MKTLILIITLLVSTLVYSTEPTDTIFSYKFDVEYLEELVFEKINEYRASKGKSKLILNSSLYDNCKKHTERMCETNIIEHATEGRQSTSECILASVAPTPYGRGTYEDKAEYIVRVWKKSPDHNSILLKDVRTNDYIVNGMITICSNGEYMYSTFRIKAELK